MGWSISCKVHDEQVLTKFDRLDVTILGILIYKQIPFNFFSIFIYNA